LGRYPPPSPQTSCPWDQCEHDCPPLSLSGVKEATPKGDRERHLMTSFAGTVDHVIPKDEVVFSFGPEMRPVLEVDPGAVVRFDTHDCFSGQIQTEGDLVTEIDFSKVNPATGPVAVRGAEPGDSLVVEILDISPGPQGVATIISGYGQLIDLVDSPITKVDEPL
jgi:hypothetical protein